MYSFTFFQIQKIVSIWLCWILTISKYWKRGNSVFILNWDQISERELFKVLQELRQHIFEFSSCRISNATKLICNFRYTLFEIKISGCIHTKCIISLHKRLFFYIINKETDIDCIITYKRSFYVLAIFESFINKWSYQPLSWWKNNTITITW